MKRRLSLALLFATFTTATNAANADKRAFCEISVPYIARAAYCSIWRTKCGLPPKVETKDEIVAKLFAGQSWNVALGSQPPIGEGDIEYLVQEAMKYTGDVDLFIKYASDNCQTAWDQNEKRRREENVTH